MNLVRAHDILDGFRKNRSRNFEGAERRSAVTPAYDNANRICDRNGRVYRRKTELVCGVVHSIRAGATRDSARSRNYFRLLIYWTCRTGSPGKRERKGALGWWGKSHTNHLGATVTCGTADGDILSTLSRCRPSVITAGAHDWQRTFRPRIRFGRTIVVTLLTMESTNHRVFAVVWKRVFFVGKEFEWSIPVWLFLKITDLRAFGAYTYTKKKTAFKNYYRFNGNSVQKTIRSCIGYFPGVFDNVYAAIALWKFPTTKGRVLN